MKDLLLILTALLFSSTQSLNGQGFEFLHAEEIDRENRVMRLYYDDDPEKVIVQLNYDNQDNELFSFDREGNVMSKMEFESSPVGQGAFPGFKEYNDSLTFLGMDSEGWSVIFIVDKSLSTSPRILLADSNYINYWIYDYEIIEETGEVIILNYSPNATVGTLTTLQKINLLTGDTVGYIQDNLWDNNPGEYYSHFKGGVRSYKLYNIYDRLLVFGAANRRLTLTEIDTSFNNYRGLYYSNQSEYCCEQISGFNFAGPWFNSELDEFAVVHFQEIDRKEIPWYFDEFPNQSNDVDLGIPALWDAQGNSGNFDNPPQRIKIIDHEIYYNFRITDFTHRNGDFYYCGYLGTDKPAEKGFLLKINDQKEVEYFRKYAYRDNPNNIIHNMHFTEEGNLVLAGNTRPKYLIDDTVSRSEYFNRVPDSAWVFDVCPETGDKRVDNPGCSPVSSPELNAGESGDVRVYPNPSTGLLNIELNSANETQITSIEVFNTTGTRVYSVGQINNTIEQIDLSGLPKGVYFIQSKLTDGSAGVDKIVLSD